MKTWKKRKNKKNEKWKKKKNMKKWKDEKQEKIHVFLIFGIFWFFSKNTPKAPHFDLPGAPFWPSLALALVWPCPPGPKVESTDQRVDEPARSHWILVSFAPDIYESHLWRTFTNWPNHGKFGLRDVGYIRRCWENGFHPNQTKLESFGEGCYGRCFRWYFTKWKTQNMKTKMIKTNKVKNKNTTKNAKKHEKWKTLKTMKQHDKKIPEMIKMKMIK